MIQKYLFNFKSLNTKLRVQFSDRCRMQRLSLQSGAGILQRVAQQFQAQ